jgi:hypothetical protein
LRFAKDAPLHAFWWYLLASNEAEFWIRSSMTCLKRRIRPCGWVGWVDGWWVVRVNLMGFEGVRDKER